MRHILIPTLLFLLTLGTTLISGSFMAGVNPFASLTGFVSGMPFSISLLSILLTHEMGHFIASKRHGILATLPYFIPGPPFPPLPGTFGAFIKMKSPVVNKRSLLDVGAAGPLAGFIVSVIVTILGVRFSKILPTQGVFAEQLGSSLLFDILTYITVGHIPDGYDLFLNPVAYAGWIGFFVTSINLLPIGQLDGGHILYAVAGTWHRFISVGFIIALVIMGIMVYEGWLIWAVIITIVGTKHPPVIDDCTPLNPARKLIMWITLLVFILTFIPAPFRM
ncbi:MAG: site-2 protease family protein [Deltaproteobacteria bacterium]|nr:site-2 protease family protein [Deltaproteobacteria bacterium]